MSENKGSTGNFSTGNFSTGNRSTGNWSTGDCSTGDCSTGNRSTGHFSTGDCSTGDWSTGNWSTGDWSTGHFCTKDGKGFGAFNKKIHKNHKKSVKIWRQAPKADCLFFDLTLWIDEKDMSDLEKETNPSYKATGGYLKALGYKEAFTASVKSASKQDRDLIRALPNFNDDVFFEISGCDLRLLDCE
jgi:hypothetical protein